MAANPVPSPPHAFSLQLTASNDVVILKCCGSLTCKSAETFHSQIKNLLSEHKVIRLDLAELLYVDSSGLGALLSAYVSARSAGCELRMVNPTLSVTNLLKMTHLASVFEAYDNK